MLEIRCIRCKKRLPEKHMMFQTITYLGKMSKRYDICNECYDALRDFMEEIDDMEE